MLPTIPPLRSGMDQNGTVSGAKKSTKNRVVLPLGRSWLYAVPLLTYVKVCGASSSLSTVILVVLNAVTLNALGTNREFSPTMATLAEAGLSQNGPVTGAGTNRFW